MKRLLVAWVVVLILMVTPSFGIEYCKDFLEPGNPGGWETSLKTFDDEWSLNIGEVVELDIWINDVPEELLSGGFLITYDSSLVSIEDVLAYDNVDLSGPWAPGFTGKSPDPEGPGTYFLILGNLATAFPDTDGDILLSKIRFRCESEGNVTMTVDVTSYYDLFVGWPSTHVYDGEIIPNTITLSQSRCAIDEDCDDNNLCTANICNPSTGACSFEPVIDCDDNDLCTTDTCDPSTGECVFDSVDCNDWDACTSDICNPGTGECVYSSVDCSFGYFTDFLEPGNPGGWTGSLKTFDDEWTLSLYEEIEFDIWLNDVPETMPSAGFWIEYDPSLVSIVDVEVYDNDLDGTEGNPSCCQGLSGPWSPQNAVQLPEAGGPGTYLVLLPLGQFFCVKPDAGGDIILGRVRVRCESLGDTTITCNTIPEQQTNVGCYGFDYDPQISPHIITLHQTGNPGNQAIPTLSEWGIIILMTIFLGISVVILYKRKEI